MFMVVVYVDYLELGCIHKILLAIKARFRRRTSHELNRMQMSHFCKIYKYLQLHLISSYFLTMAWVALGKSLPGFVYFAVEICHCRLLPSATTGFSL